MTATLRTVAGWAVLVLLLMQFVPLERINPPAGPGMKIPEGVRSDLERACFDCHSNQTCWPRAAYVAPASWLISATVAKGREALNFSTPIRRITADESEKAAAIIRGQQPHQKLYGLFNPDATLSGEAAEEAVRWLESAQKLP